MALFTWPFPKNPSAPPLLGIMALTVAAAAAILLVAGLLNLQSSDRTVQAQNVAADRAALVAFYTSANGASWTTNTNWNSNEPLGDWHGVVTNASGRVAELNLPDNNLAGSLPAELGQLSELTQLLLRDNSLTGSIPPELGDLSNLNVLSIQGNSLTATIPAELGQLSELVRLNLFSNNLTGSIPAQLGQLSNLETLIIQTNSLTGTVPAQLGSLSLLENLGLSENQLTGQLPYSFTQLSAITFLAFENNAGLCAPLDSDFQTWFQGVVTRTGDNCPATRIHSGHNPPLVNEPVTALLTSREARLARIQATLEEYGNDPCIGYDGSGNRVGLDVPVWTWERADADSNDPNSPDDSTWASVTAGRHPNATFVYLPQNGDVGKFLRASLTHGNPETTDTTDAIGPVTDSNAIFPSNEVPLVTGEVAVGNVLGLRVPAAINDERLDPAINPYPEPWQWEVRAGIVDWVNVTPYHKHCSQPDTEYLLTAADEGKNVRAYIYYNYDSSGSIVRTRANTPAYGPVAP